MPRPDSERPVVEALAVGPLSQRYRTFTAMPHFASVITLAKWRYPFENSASLAKRPPRPPEGRDFSLETAASPAKQPEQPRPATFAKPTAVSVRNGAPLHLDPQQPSAAHVPVHPPTGNLAPGGAIAGTHPCLHPAPDPQQLGAPAPVSGPQPAAMGRPASVPSPASKATRRQQWGERTANPAPWFLITHRIGPSHSSEVQS